MMAPDRTAAYCEFRRIDSSSAAPRPYCQLVRQFSGTAGPVYLEQAACDACCQYPLPTGPRLNPIVASLLHANTDRALASLSPAAAERVELHQAKQFAARWLAVADPDQLASEAEHGRCGTVSASRDASTSVSNHCRSTHADRLDRPLRIGLIGRNSPYGLGYQNRDIAHHLRIDRWLVRGAEGDFDPRRVNLPYRVDVVSRELGPIELEAWLDGLDVVLFVERPVFEDLPAIARRCGVRVVCVPNWEWLHPGLEWLDCVDLMLCPTRHTKEVLSQWKARFCFDWQIECIPWPIDMSRFRYRRRWFCRRFVFVLGSGGESTIPRRGTPTVMQRKGLAVLVAAATLVPEIPILVYASPQKDLIVPPNFQLRTPPLDNRALYDDGDVCVQPSHWEGLGLPLLECQAAGMPLITTDAPPMNEHRPWAVIPVVREAVHLNAEICIPAATIHPEDLAQALHSAHGRFLLTASRQARRFVQSQHNWILAAPRILQALSALVSAQEDGNFMPSCAARVPRRELAHSHPLE